MKQYTLAGAPLLTEGAAATEAGVSTEVIRRWAAMGLLERHDTPEGPRYPQKALRALLATAWDPPERPAPNLAPWQAARILGVGTSTLSLRARAGHLTRRRMPGGRYAYDGGQIRHIAAERERLRDPKWWPGPRD